MIIIYIAEEAQPSSFLTQPSTALLSQPSDIGRSFAYFCVHVPRVMNADATKKASDDRQREPLLVVAADTPASRDAGFSWLTVLGFTFLTFNLGLAIYRSEGDPAAVGFVAFSYLDLVLLFYCLKRFENAQPDSPARRHLKWAVWLLTTLLTAVFSYKIAAIMPLPLQILVWGMAASTVGGGFYVFFLHKEEKVSADPLYLVRCISEFFMFRTASEFYRFLQFTTSKTIHKLP
ncbi:hypothetical protein ACQ4PT_054717 [Festuca glaucescens]